MCCHVTAFTFSLKTHLRGRARVPNSSPRVFECLIAPASSSWITPLPSAAARVALLNLARTIDKSRFEIIVLLFADGPLAGRLRGRGD